MNRWRVGDDRGSKETDRCPLTTTSRKQLNPQNPLARHHPSRLTIIFSSPPPINEHNDSARILTNVNNSLALTKLDIHIAGVTWSLAGNCILLTRKGHLATDLKPHTMSISYFLIKHPIPIKDISDDKPWPQIIVDGVDTGIPTWDGNPSPHPMTYILNTLYADNPWFTNIKLKEEPRWLCGSDHISNKKHSSIVFRRPRITQRTNQTQNHIWMGTPYAHQRIPRHETELTMPQVLESHT
jgi:hypothetical protein